MAKISQKQLYNLLQVLPKIEKYLSSGRQKVVQAFKTTAYWTAVVTLGIVVSGGIMHAAGVPIFQTAEALSAGQSLALLIGNLLYYGWIGPYGIILIALAYILQIIINYPHGTFWQTIDTSNDVAVGYVNVEAVITGWKLVRDICNIFFSIILVVIALGSVLKIEKYSWKQLLPKFIVMAILINFSKSICGVFTDVATVAMATFAGSFGDTFAIGLLGAFNVTSLTEFTPSAKSETYQATSAVGIVGGFLAAAIMMLVFGIIITVLVAVFFLRIVMLWFLIVLSPVAYIARILPMTQSYAGRWWSMFGKWVVVGPLMTFFLWLTLTMAYGVETGNPIGSEGFGEEAQDLAGARVGIQAPGNGFQATSTSQMATFMVGTVMLLGSLKLVKDLAEGAGAVVGKAEGLGKAAFGGAITGSSMRRLTSGAGGIAGWAGNKAGDRLGEGKAGNFARGLGGFTNYGATMLAGTAFDPVTAVNRIGERISNRSKSSKAKFDAKYDAQMGGGAEKTDAWVGQGGATGALAAVAGLLTGAAAAVGKDGQTHWDRGFTSDRLRGIGSRFGKDKKIEALKEQETAQENLVENLKNGKDVTGKNDQLSQELYESKQDERAQAEKDSEAAYGLRDAINNDQLTDVAVDLDDQAMANAIASAIREMEASKAEAQQGFDDEGIAGSMDSQIAALKQLTDPKNADRPQNLDELTAQMSGAAGGNTDAARAAMRAMKGELANGFDQKGAERANKVGEIDQTLGNVDPANLPSVRAEQKKLIGIRKEIGKAGRGKIRNPQARASARAAVKEAADSMEGMSQSELQDQLDLATGTQDQAKGIAALKELAGTFGGLQDAMEDMGGSVDMDGANEMAEKLQKQLGMSKEGAYQFMNELIEKSGLSHLSGVFTQGRKGFTANDTRGAMKIEDFDALSDTEKDALDPAVRKATEAKKSAIGASAGIMKGMGAGQLARKQGLKAFAERGVKGETLSAAGLKAIVSASHTWADSKAFGGLSDGFKDELLENKQVMSQLKSSKASKAFLKKLERYGAAR